MTDGYTRVRRTRAKTGARPTALDLQRVEQLKRACTEIGQLPHYRELDALFRIKRGGSYEVLRRLVDLGLIVVVPATVRFDAAELATPGAVEVAP